MIKGVSKLESSLDFVDFRVQDLKISFFYTIGSDSLWVRVEVSSRETRSRHCALVLSESLIGSTGTLKSTLGFEFLGTSTLDFVFHFHLFHFIFRSMNKKKFANFHRSEKLLLVIFSKKSALHLFKCFQWIFLHNFFETLPKVLHDHHRPNHIKNFPKS